GSGDHRGLGKDSADRLAGGGETLICAHFSGLSARFLPPKELEIEAQGFLPVRREQLVPAHAARCAQFRRLPSSGLQPFEYRQSCRLRVSEDAKATDVGNVCWWDVHCSAKVLDAVGGSVHVADLNIPNPARPSAHFPRFLRQVHEPAYQGASSSKQRIRPT